MDGVLQGAPWRLDVPAGWNGELVMLAHGYEPKGVPRPTPMAANDTTAALTGAGFAVAQSAYASQGWAVADAIADTERLRRHVLAQLPGLRHTWLLGFSMGGAVTLATLERTPHGYDGGVALCGANLPGEVLANDLLTTLVAFDYFFRQADGLPRGGLLAAETAALPQATLYQSIATALQGDADAAALLATRLQVQPDTLAGAISLHALVLHELIERAGGMPVSNIGVRYSGFGDDAAFNAGVARVRAAPAAQRYVHGPLALTGALLNPGDAIYAGLADVHVAEERRSAVFDALLQVAWSADAAHNHERLSQLLQSHASDAATGPLLANAATVDALCEGDALPAIIERIRTLQTDDAWLQAAQKTLAAGAPGSARLAFELQRRSAGQDLASVYRLEYITALHCAAHGDFAEGIRALLIDKDRNPQWNPATLAEASTAWADTFFVSPWADAAHPLADLGTPMAERSLA
ncbi:MAG TPA: hypothetical protein DCP40_06520 [Stenotrophomonas sp.]|nr:hypothetical protein [Stenotrophomonas sp.]